MASTRVVSAYFEVVSNLVFGKVDMQAARQWLSMIGSCDLVSGPAWGSRRISIWMGLEGSREWRSCKKPEGEKGCGDL